ncbi:MAG: M43 family zinc metalloprotease [Bacteroidota bacterium]
MKNQVLLLIVGFLFFSTGLTAQPPCGFDLAHQNLLATDPGYAQRINEANTSIRRYIDAHPELRTPSRTMRTMALYTIPVVVHVMHTGGPIGSTYNPTDLQITGAINYLNQVYAGTYPGMTAPSPGGAAGDIDIQFALAQRTPTCGATNGIDRVDASSIPNYTSFGVNSSNSNGVPDLTLKNFARWNPSDYYNIWVVNKIDGADGTSGQFIAGYAYFAGASASLDGTVMLATQMVSGESTLPHEIGHALNLYHPFQGSANSSQCPPYTASPTCYSDGDLVCDTDPISNNNVAGVYDFSCRTGNNTCTSGPVKPYSLNTESNFMSYTNCYTLFTNDQKARMQAAMSLPSRASLVSGSNMALVPCGAVINFSQATASRTESITGTTTGCRTYIDYTYQMVIGAAPTATATATLSYSGTGIKGLDYDVTTNGNFASPSDVLTFNTGVTTAQSFTVRVYDDENEESAETAIIDFTVNNGGGDATKGITSPTLTFTLNDNDQAPVGTATGTLASIGPAYTTNITGGSCFRSSKVRHRVQYLITKAEMNTAGLNSVANLTSLKFRVLTKNSTKPFSGFTISLGHNCQHRSYYWLRITFLYSGIFTSLYNYNR